MGKLYCLYQMQAAIVQYCASRVHYQRWAQLSKIKKINRLPYQNFQARQFKGDRKVLGHFHGIFSELFYNDDAER